MGIYDKIVREVLGQEAWDILRNSVISGELDAQKMEETAQKFRHLQ